MVPVSAGKFIDDYAKVFGPRCETRFRNAIGCPTQCGHQPPTSKTGARLVVQDAHDQHRQIIMQVDLPGKRYGCPNQAVHRSLGIDAGR